MTTTAVEEETCWLGLEYAPDDAEDSEFDLAYLASFLAESRGRLGAAVRARELMDLRDAVATHANGKLAGTELETEAALAVVMAIDMARPSLDQILAKATEAAQEFAAARTAKLHDTASMPKVEIDARRAADGLVFPPIDKPHAPGESLPTWTKGSVSRFV